MSQCLFVKGYLLYVISMQKHEPDVLSLDKGRDTSGDPLKRIDKRP